MDFVVTATNAESAGIGAAVTSRAPAVCGHPVAPQYGRPRSRRRYDDGWLLALVHEAVHDQVANQRSTESAVTFGYAITWSPVD